LEKREEIRRLRPGGRRDTEGHQHRLAVRFGKGLLHNGRRRLRPDRALAGGADRSRNAREEELQVIVDLRHRPDGGAGGLHRVRLFDGDGGWDAANLIHLRLVHPLQELAGVGAERLHVAPLALGIERVEGETRFAAAARTGDDRQFPDGKVEIDPFKVILPRATDLDEMFGVLLHCGWKR